MVRRLLRDLGRLVRSLPDEIAGALDRLDRWAARVNRSRAELEEEWRRESLAEAALASKYNWLPTRARWARLHFVPDVTFDDWGNWWEDGVEHCRVALCGLTTEFDLPGFPSRMGLPRCQRCCQLAGIKPGYGAPFNDPDEARL